MYIGISFPYQNPNKSTLTTKNFGGKKFGGIIFGGKKFRRGFSPNIFPTEIFGIMTFTSLSKIQFLTIKFLIALTAKYILKTVIRI